MKALAARFARRFAWPVELSLLQGLRPENIRERVFRGNRPWEISKAAHFPSEKSPDIFFPLLDGGNEFRLSSVFQLRV